MRGLRLAGARGWMRENGLSLLLCAAVVLQTGILVRGQILPLVERVRQVWSMPALERSGRLAFGDAFWEYIDFIRRTVPEDAIVIIPPEAVDVALGSEGIMQYYLFPRGVSNCPRGEPLEPCILRLTGSNSYILAVPGFPPRAAAEQVKRFLPLDRYRGIYVPTPLP